MKLGNNLLFLAIYLMLTSSLFLQAEDKILSAPLINLEKLKPSFEEEETVKNDLNDKEMLKNKNKIQKKEKLHQIELIGLDKITAKTSQIKLKLGEEKKFGPLQIKVLKCSKIESGNKEDHVAYLQVKDLSEDQDEKVFIFNGWTFSSDPSITPFDHAIYDLQLVECNNV